MLGGSRSAESRDSYGSAVPEGECSPVSQAVMAFPAVFTGAPDWARGEPEHEPALRESLM